MRYNICILVLLLFVLSGCEKEINLEHMRPEPKLVLNCLAVQGDTLSVELSRTWFYADNKVKDIFVSGADVKLYVNDVFRESLSEVAVKYEELDIDAIRYKSSSYIPVAGDRIRLVASRNGFKDVEAVTEVPRPCSVSGFELQQESVRDTTEWFDDAYIHLAQNNTVCFTLHDEPGEDNYYNRQNEKYEFSKRKVQEETFEYSLNEVRTSLFHSVILYPFERSHIEFKQDIFTTFN